MTTDEARTVGIVTGDRAPELSRDGRALAAALADQGLAAEPVVWFEDEDWSAVDALLVRSCWGYYRRADAFRDWLATVEAAETPVWNPVPALRWNRHKFYLRDLAERGVDVLPTAFVERDDDVELATLLRDRGWDDAVVKPAVGTSSADVFRTDPDSAPTDQERVEGLQADGDVLVQQFAPEIRDGERSLVFFEGEYSHATVSVPTGGDFRAHPDFGVEIEPYEPPPAVLEDAADALGTARSILGLEPADLRYARVDGIERDGRFRLVELELIEPYLGLQRSGTVERFADVVAAAIDRECGAGGR